MFKMCPHELFEHIIKPIQRLDLGKTSYKDFVFVRGEFLRLVGAQNESLGTTLIYYMFKY